MAYEKPDQLEKLMVDIQNLVQKAELPPEWGLCMAVVNTQDGATALHHPSGPDATAKIAMAACAFQAAIANAYRPQPIGLEDILAENIRRNMGGK